MGLLLLFLCLFVSIWFLLLIDHTKTPIRPHQLLSLTLVFFNPSLRWTQKMSPLQSSIPSHGLVAVLILYHPCQISLFLCPWPLLKTKQCVCQYHRWVYAITPINWWSTNWTTTMWLVVTLFRAHYWTKEPDMILPPASATSSQYCMLPLLNCGSAVASGSHLHRQGTLDGRQQGQML